MIQLSHFTDLRYLRLQASLQAPSIRFLRASNATPVGLRVSGKIPRLGLLKADLEGDIICSSQMVLTQRESLLRKAISLNLPLSGLRRASVLPERHRELYGHGSRPRSRA